MTLEQQAFASILPSWTLVRQGEKTGAWYEKGALTIRLVQLPSGSAASVQIKGKKSLMYRCPQGTTSFELALLDVKSYLDTAFPGMA